MTAADLAADRVIAAGLAALDPATPVVSEEQDASHDGTPARFWLVDPLDGTREFVRGGDDYTVNIALVEDGVPVLGVVHAPATGVSYAAARGAGATRIDAGGARRIAVRRAGGGTARRWPRATVRATASWPWSRAARTRTSAGGVPGRAAAAPADLDRQLAQAVPGRRGQRRPLPAHRPDLVVGHRGRPRRGDRSRRRGHDAGRRAAALRRPEHPQPVVRLLGRAARELGRRGGSRRWPDSGHREPR